MMQHLSFLSDIAKNEQSCLQNNKNKISAWNDKLHIDYHQQQTYLAHTRRHFPLRHSKLSSSKLHCALSISRPLLPLHLLTNVLSIHVVVVGDTEFGSNIVHWAD